MASAPSHVTVHKKLWNLMADESFIRRKRHLQNLVVMALADGQLGEREVNVVADRCIELGLSEVELHEAIRYSLSDDAALELPEDPDEREALMKDLIRVMAADGDLQESEKRLFALAAARMNLTPDDLDRLLASMPPISDAGAPVQDIETDEGSES